MYKVSAHDINAIFCSLGSSAKAIAARMLVLQSQLLTADSQPQVNFYSLERSHDERRRYQEKINFYLHSLKDYYQIYQSRLAPELQRWMANADAFWSTQSDPVVEWSLKNGKRELAERLKYCCQIAHLGTKQGHELMNELTRFQQSLEHEASRCDISTNELNRVMNGDINILSAISSQLKVMDSHLSKSLTESVYTSIGQEGIHFLLAAGHLAELFTTSEPTHLVLGSGAIISRGLESEVTDTVHQASLLNRKSELINLSTGLHSEVMMSMGIASGMHKLGSAATALLESVRQMMHCWQSLAAGLEHLRDDRDDAGNSGRQQETEKVLRQLRSVECRIDSEISITSLLFASIRARIATDAERSVSIKKQTVGIININ